MSNLFNSNDIYSTYGSKSLEDLEVSEDFGEGLGLKIDVPEGEDVIKFDDFDLSESGSFQKGDFKINQKWKNNWKFEDIETGVLLGQGASGVVYKAFHTKTHQTIAVKCVNAFETAKRDQITKELQTLVFVPPNNKYVVGFFGAFYHEGVIYLALEYMEGGSLKDLYEHTANKLDEAVISIISYQILNGMQYLHKTSKTLHRDLKPPNILMNKFGQFKITDFGVSKKHSTLSTSDCNTFIGTITYMSPERLNGSSYSFSSDVWSFGVTIMEICMRKFPFSKDGKELNNFWGLFNYLKQNDPPQLDPKQGYSKELCHFLSCCLKVKPHERATTNQLLNHPFITKHIMNKKSQLIYTNWVKRQLGLMKEKHNNAPKYSTIKQKAKEALDLLEL